MTKDIDLELRRNHIADKAWSMYQQKSAYDRMLRSISAHQLRTAIGVTTDAAITAEQEANRMNQWEEFGLAESAERIAQERFVTPTPPTAPMLSDSEVGQIIRTAIAGVQNEGIYVAIVRATEKKVRGES